MYEIVRLASQITAPGSERASASRTAASPASGPPLDPAPARRSRQSATTASSTAFPDSSYHVTPTALSSRRVISAKISPSWVPAGFVSFRGLASNPCVWSIGPPVPLAQPVDELRPYGLPARRAPRPTF